MDFKLPLVDFINICVWLHHDWLLFPKCRGCWHHHRQWDGSGPWHWSHVGHGVHRPGQGRRLHCRYCMHALVFVYHLDVLMGICDRVTYCRTIGALITTSGRHIDRPQQTFTESWMFIFYLVSGQPELGLCEHLVKSHGALVVTPNFNHGFLTGGIIQLFLWWSSCPRVLRQPSAL